MTTEGASCRICGEKIPTDTKVCPHCDEQVSPDTLRANEDNASSRLQPQSEVEREQGSPHSPIKPFPRIWLAPLLILNVAAFFYLEQGVPYPWFGSSCTGVDLCVALYVATQRGYYGDQFFLGCLMFGPIVTALVLFPYVLLALMFDAPSPLLDVALRRTSVLRTNRRFGVIVLTVGAVAALECLLIILKKDSGVAGGVLVQLGINILFCVTGAVALLSGRYVPPE